MTTRHLIAALSILGLSLLGCSTDNPESAGQGDAKALPESPSQATAIPWFEGSIEEAFAEAKASGKPLFLYWGADWCPYCKKLEATIFIREEFIRLSQQFVPLDLSNGDSEVIQHSDRFRIYGLPTVIVFSPSGEELTRIPGGTDMAQYAAVLELTLNKVRPVSTLVAAAVSGEALSKADWELLSNYSWRQDRGLALGEENPTQVMLDLQAAAPTGDKVTRARLALAAMVVWLQQDEETRDPDLAEVHLEAVEGIIADASLARDNLVTLTGFGGDIVEMAEGERQKSLQRSLLSLYRPAIEDPGQNLLNRASFLSAWVDVATKLLDEDETLTDKQIDWARQQADQFVAGLDQYQVHAGVSSLWGVYYDLGLEQAARETLALGIERSSAPFYFMSAMGYVETEAGNTTEALGWYRKAWEAASNPVDRVRWGGGYVRRLVKMAPQDTAEVERASSTLLADLTSQPDGLAVYDRLTNRLGEILKEWAAEDSERQAVLANLGDQLAASCKNMGEEDPGRSACDSFSASAGA